MAILAVAGPTLNNLGQSTISWLQHKKKEEDEEKEEKEAEEKEGTRKRTGAGGVTSCWMNWLVRLEGRKSFVTVRERCH